MPDFTPPEPPAETELEAPAEEEAAAEEPAEGEPAEREPDDEPEDERHGEAAAADEPSAEPEAAASEGAVDVSEAVEKLARSATTWRNRVSTVLGEDAAYLVPCELCEPDIPGFHWPAELMQPANALQARLVEVLSGPAEPDYRTDPVTETCPDCDGWGKTSTGSRVATHQTRACPTCKAYGYVPPPGAPQNGPTEGAAVPALVAAEPSEATREDADVWGSPRLLDDGQQNPNFGKMPQYKDANLP